MLSVDFTRAPQQFLTLVEEIQPTIIISLGLAAGNTRIMPERVAINIRDGEKDNRGIAYVDAPIREDGDAAYFSTLPIRNIVNRLTGQAIQQLFQILLERIYVITSCMKAYTMQKILHCGCCGLYTYSSFV